MAIYYITPIIGTGNRQTGDGFRTAIEDYTKTYASIITSYTESDLVAGTIPAGKKVGDPMFSWCLVIVPDTTAPAVLTAIAADATIDRLPITSLDVTIGSLTNQQRNTLRSIGTKYGVTKISGLTNQDTCRDALVAIGQALNPNFDASAFATA